MVLVLLLPVLILLPAANRQARKRRERYRKVGDLMLASAKEQGECIEAKRQEAAEGWRELRRQHGLDDG